MTIPKNWSFEGAEVAEGFDAHVREQLPWYDLATFATVHLARQFLYERAVVYELGASTGNLGRALEETIRDRKIRYVALERSEEMARRYSAPMTELLVRDAREFEFLPCDLVIAFLVLMFVPPADRDALLRRIWSALRPGGALIVVDKSEPVGGYLGTALLRLALAAKHAAGTPASEILEKELSLAGVQVPFDFASLDDGDLAEFFRFGDFRGVVIRKRPRRGA